jgi:hypothetical protein
LVETREFRGKAYEEGVHMPKEKTGSHYTEEFKVEGIA